MVLAAVTPVKVPKGHLRALEDSKKKRKIRLLVCHHQRVGKPRFKPARICANPRHFGRIPTPQWADPCPLDPTETAWAIFQHRAAVAVMLELRAAGETTADLAERLGEDPAWLTRKLHGQTPIDIGDVMKWAAELGVQIIPVFDDGMELQLTLS